MLYTSQSKHEASPTSEQEEEKRHEKSVSEVQECADETLDFEFGDVEMNSVQEEVEGGEATCKK